jgi:integrase
MIPELIEKHSGLEYREDDNRLLFTEAVKQWLESKDNKIERSTYEGYQSYIDCHIIPYFAPLKLPIDEVTPKHIKDFYEYLFRNGRKDGKGGLSVRSIKKYSIVLKQVFKEALLAEQVTRNPATGVPFPINEKPEFKGLFLTGEEANRMLQAVAGHELQAMIYVTLYYGLRRSDGYVKHTLKKFLLNFYERNLPMKKAQPTLFTKSAVLL